MIQSLVVQDGTAVYRLHPVDPDEAASVGCDGATHKRVGTYTTTYGQWRETSGKPVRVRRKHYTAMLGVHGRWFDFGDDVATFSGWTV